MRGPQGPINAVPTVVVDYAPDPRGWSLFTGLTAVLHRGMTGHTGTVYTGDRGDPSRTFNGDSGGNLQHFTGAAALSLYGAAKTNTGAGDDLSSSGAADYLNDPALRIMAARARREQML